MPIGGMMAQDTQNAEMNRFIDNLMNKMTIEEKIGQLNMPNIDGAVITGPVRIRIPVNVFVKMKWELC